MTRERRPTVRHSAARAEVGECYCPKCAPDLHAPVQVDLPLAAAASAPEPASPSAPLAPSPERIVVGGYSLGVSEDAMRAEYARLQEALRGAEARWLSAYGGLHEALDEERCAASAVRSLQRDLRAATKGLVRVEADQTYRADSPRLSPALVAALTETHRCAVALVSAMSGAPDWREQATAPRRDLMRAFELLDAEAMP